MATKKFKIPLIFVNDVSFLSFAFFFGNQQPFSLKAKFSHKILTVCPLHGESEYSFIFNETCSSGYLFQTYFTYSNTFGPENFKNEYEKNGYFGYAQIEIEVENLWGIDLELEIETMTVLEIETRSYGNERAPIQRPSLSTWNINPVNHTPDSLNSNINGCVNSPEMSVNIGAILPLEIDFYIPINWREESLNIDIGDNKLKLSNSEWHQSNENEEIIHINDTYVKLGWNKIIVVAANQNSVKISDISGNIWIDKGKQVVKRKQKIPISISGLLFFMFNCKTDTRTFLMTTKIFTIPLIFQNDVSFLSFELITFENPQTFSLKAKFSQKILSVCPLHRFSKNSFIFNETCSSGKRFEEVETYSNTFGPENFKNEYVKIDNFSYAQIEIEVETDSEIYLKIEIMSYGNERAPLQLHSFSSLKNQYFNHTQDSLNSNHNDKKLIITITTVCFSFIAIALILGASWRIMKSRYPHRRGFENPMFRNNQFALWPEMNNYENALPGERNMEDEDEIARTSNITTENGEIVFAGYNHPSLGIGLPEGLQEGSEHENYYELEEDQSGYGGDGSEHENYYELEDQSGYGGDDDGYEYYENEVKQRDLNSEKKLLHSQSENIIDKTNENNVIRKKKRRSSI